MVAPPLRDAAELVQRPGYAFFVSGLPGEREALLQKRRRPPEVAPSLRRGAQVDERPGYALGVLQFPVAVQGFGAQRPGQGGISLQPRREA